MKVILAGSPDDVVRAFTDPFRFRRWYAGPPGAVRVGAEGSLDAFTIRFVDDAGRPFLQRGRIVELGPARIVVESRWTGGGLPRAKSRAVLTLGRSGKKTHLAVRVPKALAPLWRANTGRLARLLAGEAPPCFEELADEAHGFEGVLGAAAWAVLAGMREGGASPRELARVEDALYTHLARAPEETQALLRAVLQSRTRT